MTFFHHLPSSVLYQAGAIIFSSIIIEALPFVLIGSIISGIIEGLYHPREGLPFLPKNKFERIFFGTFIGFYLSFLWMWDCSHYQSLSRKEKFPVYCCSLLVTAPVINPIVLLRPTPAFGNSVKMALYRALGSLLVAQRLLGIFLGFIQTDSIQKEHRKAVHEHDF